MVEIQWVLSLSGFAALVRYAQAFTGNKDSRPAWEWGVACIHVGTGSFVGLLTSWVIGSVTQEVRYVYFAIAIAGYGGPITLDFFQQLFRDAITRAAQKGADKDAKG